MESKDRAQAQKRFTVLIFVRGRRENDCITPREIICMRDTRNSYMCPGQLILSGKLIICPPHVLDTPNMRRDEPHEPFLSSRPSIAGIPHYFYSVVSRHYPCSLMSSSFL